MWLLYNVGYDPPTPETLRHSGRVKRCQEPLCLRPTPLPLPTITKRGEPPHSMTSIVSARGFQPREKTIDVICGGADRERGWYAAVVHPHAEGTARSRFASSRDRDLEALIMRICQADKVRD